MPALPNHAETTRVLSQSQVDSFITDGVLVVDNILLPLELEDARNGLRSTLQSRGVDSNDLERTGHHLQKLSSTNGSGGVLDLFYPAWKLQVASNTRLFQATCQLWEAAYCHMGEKQEELQTDDLHRWHPYGSFDCHRGYMYVDRIGFRLPTDLAKRLGVKSGSNKKSKPIQRSLTPHLDCCPGSLFANTSKWRPVQCFVSLTENLEADMGGFEAACGFHRQFDAWALGRPPSTVVRNAIGHSEEVRIAAPCIGDYTHIRPKEDADVLARIRHVPVRAGAAVFWDNRIPHANAYRHLGRVPRSVVYCSFLPDVELNRKYVKRQLLDYQEKRKPGDQWNHHAHEQEEIVGHMCDDFTGDDSLFRKFMGMEPW